MKIKSLHIKNFRCFDDFKIEFNDQLTVLVGPNGAGKTAVLDALAFLLEKIMKFFGNKRDEVHPVFAYLTF